MRAPFDGMQTKIQKLYKDKNDKYFRPIKEEEATDYR